MKKWLDKYQTGGAISPENAAISKVLMERNKGKNFVDRAFNNKTAPKLQTNKIPGYENMSDKQYSTHLMAYDVNPDGTGRVYPDVVQKPGDKGLTYLGGDNSWNYADSTGEYITTPTAKIADMLSDKGYKKATGIRTYETGGVAKTAKQQNVGLNNPVYNTMSFPISGEHMFRGLNNGQPVMVLDATGKKRVLYGPQDTDTFTGPVDEVRMQTGGVTPTDRNNWNNYIQYARQQPGYGAETMNHGPVGQQWLQQYNQQNPQAAVNPNAVANIQQDWQNIATGQNNMFGAAGQRAINRVPGGISPVDSYIGTKTSAQQYPQLQFVTKEGTTDFGTDWTAGAKAIDAYKNKGFEGFGKPESDINYKPPTLVSGEKDASQLDFEKKKAMFPTYAQVQARKKGTGVGWQNNPDNYMQTGGYTGQPIIAENTQPVSPGSRYKPTVSPEQEKETSRLAKVVGKKIKDQARSISAVGSMVPFPLVQWPSIAINSGIGAMDVYDDVQEGDYGKAAFDLVTALPLPKLPTAGAPRELLKKINKYNNAALFTNTIGAADDIGLLKTPSKKTGGAVKWLKKYQ